MSAVAKVRYRPSFLFGDLANMLNTHYIWGHDLVYDTERGRAIPFSAIRKMTIADVEKGIASGRFRRAARVDPAGRKAERPTDLDALVAPPVVGRRVIKSRKGTENMKTKSSKSAKVVTNVKPSSKATVRNGKASKAKAAKRPAKK